MGRVGRGRSFTYALRVAISLDDVHDGCVTKMGEIGARVGGCVCVYGVTAARLAEWLATHPAVILPFPLRTGRQNETEILAANGHLVSCTQKQQTFPRKK